MKTIDRCPVCNAASLRTLYSKKVNHPGDLSVEQVKDSDYRSNPDLFDRLRNLIMFKHIVKTSEPVEFTFHICTECGFIFFNPRWEQEEMATKYRILSEYHGAEDGKEQEAFPLDYRRARDIYRLFQTHHPLSEKRILDVGGATGYNLKYFSGTNDCFVVDYEPRIMIRDVTYLGKDVRDISADDTFDAILYCHVLEHEVEPVQALAHLKQHLSDEGVLYLEVPLGCFREYRNLKNFITHVNFFSEGSLEQTLFEAGFSPFFLETRLSTYRWFYLLSILCLAKKSSGPSAPEEPYQRTLRQMHKHTYHVYRLWGKMRTRLTRKGTV